MSLDVPEQGPSISGGCGWRFLTVLSPMQVSTDNEEQRDIGGSSESSAAHIGSGRQQSTGGHELPSGTKAAVALMSSGAPGAVIRPTANKMQIGSSKHSLSDTQALAPASVIAVEALPAATILALTLSSGRQKVHQIQQFLMQQIRVMFGLIDGDVSPMTGASVRLGDTSMELATTVGKTHAEARKLS